MITLVDAIDALLPQTQCTKCGSEGCRPYAEAIARGDADIISAPGGAAASSSWRSCSTRAKGSQSRQRVEKTRPRR